MSNATITTSYINNFIELLTDPRLSYILGLTKISFLDLNEQVIEELTLREFTNRFDDYCRHYGTEPIHSIHFEDNIIKIVFFLQLDYENFIPLKITKD